jgi:RNA polymerase sigma-70 factor (ECF subfamily)
MDERNSSDRELVVAYLQGSADAFDRLYDRYRKPLYGYLSQLVPGRSALADDLFQQTWVKVLDALPRYQEQQKFIGWLFRIAHNLVMDNFRAAGTGQGEGDVALEEIEEVVAAGGMDAAEQVADGELKEALARVIGNLGAEQKEVLLLRQQGIPFKEIAEIQKVSINTVLGRMHYAVQNIRRELREWL